MAYSEIKHNTTTKGYDAYLIINYILLIIIGWFAIYSSAHDPNVAGIANLSKPYGRQLLWIGMAMIEIMVLLLIDRRLITNLAYHFYLFCTLLMIAVLVLGAKISGAQAWIKIGSFTCQPVEFMKLGVALALAKFLSEGKTQAQKTRVWIYSFSIVLIAILLTLLQHDTGSALVFLSFVILFYREGLSAYLLLFGFIGTSIFVSTLLFNELYTVAGLIIIFLFLWFINRKNKEKIRRNFYILVTLICFSFSVTMIYDHLFQDHQKQRIDSILGKSSDPQKTDYNLNQSKIAIGAGSWFGKGYLKSTQTQLKFVPEQTTDFIFCGIAEQFGFFGSIIICGLFLSLIIRIIILAEKNRINFVKYYGYGIAGIFFFHFAINIGMTIGVLPIIGIPLPFISYGGTAMLAFTAMLFIFIKLSDN